METTQVVQELKAERVQQELLFSDVADEPCWVSLKAERVQEPSIIADEGQDQFSSAFEMTLSQKQPVTIELMALQTVITLHGTVAANNTACAAQAPGQTKEGGEPCQAVTHMPTSFAIGICCSMLLKGAPKCRKASLWNARPWRSCWPRSGG